MKRFFWFLFILTLAIIAGILIIKVPGYVLLQIKDYSIATPLWLAVLSIVVTICVIYGLYRLLAFILRIPSSIHGFNVKSRRARIKLQLHNSLHDLLVGNYSNAIKSFSQLAKKTKRCAKQSYLLAAYCAKQNKDDNSYHEMFDLAAKTNSSYDNDQIALDIMRIDTLIAKKEFSAAKEILAESTNTKDLYIIERSLIIAIALKEWGEALELVKKLKKSKAKPDNTINEILIDIYNKMLNQISKINHFDDVQTIWEMIPHKFKTNPVIKSSYINQLKRFDDNKKCAKVLCTLIPGAI